MKFAETLKRGSSSCFFKSVEPEDWKRLKTAGLDCIELSFSYDAFMNELDFPNRAEQYAENAKRAGLEIWSVHLPFSSKLDVSSGVAEYRDTAIHANELLLKAAGRVGVPTAVLHPSSEPITDAERPERLRRSREAILYLKGIADRAGVELAVENLPRTCLCNKADEMIGLLRGTGAKVVFDTNHSLIQENVGFLKELIRAGLTIWSLHISDYDFVDERHRLPGCGVNNWNEILAVLEQAGYCGPLMYEVPSASRDHDPRYDVSLEQLVQNMKDLAAGLL